MKSLTYSWKNRRRLSDIQAALQSRGYSHVIDKRGLTIEWDDPTVTAPALKTLIASWVEEDRAKHGAVRVLVKNGSPAGQ